MRNPFQGIGAVVYKETIHIRRDSTAIVFALMIPILQMTILGFGIDTNIRQIKTVILDDVPITVSRNIAVGHKLAAQAIEKGEIILKYSCPIGTATSRIEPGEYVHTHNVESNYLPTYTLPR